MNEITLFNQDGKILASSRDVAEKFNKRNPDVNRAIENLIVQNCTVKNMFIKTSYTSGRGRNENEYLIDRDGFSLLVMGFTGKKALEWKLKYIDAFNKMEETIKSGDYLSEEEKLKLQLFSKDPLEVASAHNRLVELEVGKATAPLLQENTVLNNENDLLTQKNLEWADRPLINSLIRAYASSVGDFGKAWNNFKKELLYKHGINLNSRITNYLNTTGKKTKPKTLDMIDESELASAISTAVSLCRENDVEISDLLNNKAS